MKYDIENLNEEQLRRGYNNLRKVRSELCRIIDRKDEKIRKLNKRIGV